MEFSYVSMWESMGGVARAVVYVLLLMSIGSFGIALERLFAFYRAAEQSRRFAREVQPHLAGRAFAAIVTTQGRYRHSPLAQLIGASVAEYDQALRAHEAGATYDVVAAAERASERSIDTELQKLRRGLGVLATVGSTAPFVGLFGTIFGIINAFQSMGEGQGDLATIGPGIAEALVTTALGIVVAILGVWFYNAHTARLDEVGGALSLSRREIADYFIKDQGRARA